MKAKYVPILILFLSYPALGLELESQSSAPRDFIPFVIEDAEGTPHALDHTGYLTLPQADLEARQAEISQRKSDLQSEGFTLGTSGVAENLEGRTMSVGEYTEKMNAAERDMNRYGYSLRDEGQTAISDQQVVDTEKMEHQVQTAGEVYPKEQDESGGFPSYDEIKSQLDAKHEQVKSDIEEYKKQYENLTIKDLYVKGERHKCEPGEDGELGTDEVECFVGEIEDLDPGSRPFLTADEEDKCAPDTPLGRDTLINETWMDSGGDSDFGWVGDAKFKLNTDAKGLTIDSTASAEGLFMGQTKKMLQAEASFTSPRKGQAKGKLMVKAFGRDLIDPMDKSWDLHLVDSLDNEGNEKYIVQEDIKILSTVIPMGFIPITLTLDAQVTIGPRYKLDLMPVQVIGSAEWVQRYTLIATAGIGADLEVFVIIAGVKGYIDLIDATIGSYPKVGLKLDEDNRPHVFAKFNAKAKMRTLSGKLKLGVWAKTTFSVPQSKSDFPFVEMKPYEYEWSTTLGEYPGYDFPIAVLFEKKVGYDICTGRKEVETLVANEPREPDSRQSFEIEEKARVLGLESQALQLIERELGSQQLAALVEAQNQLMEGHSNLSAKQITVSHELLTVD